MIIGGSYICPLCKKDTSSTLIGKDIYTTDVNAIDKCIGALPKMRVSSVPQIVWDTHSTKFGYRKIILNANCPNCGANVETMTNFRDVYMTFGRVVARMLMQEAGIVQDNHMNEAGIVSRINPTIIKHLLKYKNNIDSTPTSSGTSVFRAVGIPTIFLKWNLEASDELFVAFHSFSKKFIVVDWKNLFPVVVSEIRSIIANIHTINMSANEVMERAIEYMFSISRTPNVPPFCPMIMLDMKRQSTIRSIITNISHIDDSAEGVYGINTFKFVANGRPFRTYMFNLNYITKGIRNQNCSFNSKFTHCSGCRNEHDSSELPLFADSMYCDDCPEVTTGIRDECSMYVHPWNME